MAFAGTRTRGSACGCCDNTCGICEAEGAIAFCIRLTGVAPEGGGGSCEECSDLNATYSGPGIFGGDLILHVCTNCALDGSTSGQNSFPDVISNLRACYKADFDFLGSTGICIAVINCPSSLPSIFAYRVRAALLKPNQPGMGTDTSELHIVISYADFVVLHGKYVFTSLPFDCQNVDWTAMEIIDRYDESEEEIPINQCDWSVAAMEFKFGGECGNGSPAVEMGCCEGVSLPGTLYLTVTGGGATPDTPISGGHVGVNIEYNGSDEPSFVLITFSCMIQLGGLPDIVTLVLDEGGGSTVEITMTIHNCEPFYATGSDPSRGWTVEITE